MKTDFIQYIDDSGQGRSYTKFTQGEKGQKNWSKPAYTRTKWMNDPQQFF